ncbi:zinc metalloprotease [Pseudochryseolinea flava]|uniref:hypothetical protein n=1 Tax=Pseudochryseolinea flava TaxID=2059302 RepID=UPI001FEA1FE1|nr:hypothetical protein [Pseudochryseolinea flava]
MYHFSDEALTTQNYQRCLERLIKTSSHEIGHMFSCLHCTHAVCVLNGSNSLPESDLKPNRLCSECLHKLQWNLGFDIGQRNANLVAFFKQHGLLEDLLLAEKDKPLLGREN